MKLLEAVRLVVDAAIKERVILGARDPVKYFRDIPFKPNEVGPFVDFLEKSALNSVTAEDDALDRAFDHIFKCAKSKGLVPVGDDTRDGFFTYLCLMIKCGHVKPVTDFFVLLSNELEAAE